MPMYRVRVNGQIRKLQRGGWRYHDKVFQQTVDASSPHDAAFQVVRPWIDRVDGGFVYGFLTFQKEVVTFDTKVYEVSTGDLVASGSLLGESATPPKKMGKPKNWAQQWQEDTARRRQEQSE